MAVLAALAIGTLFGAGTWLLLRRNVFLTFVGLVLLTHGTNLLLFSAGGLVRGAPPLGDAGSGVTADPLPQALVLTALVIGLGIQSFLLLLVHRLQALTGSGDLHEIGRREPGQDA